MKAENHRPLHWNQYIVQNVSGLHNIQNHALYSTYQRRVQNLIHIKKYSCVYLKQKFGF